MPIIEPDTYDVLVSATRSSDAYAAGAKRKKLRAALDIASSQITSHVLGFEAPNPMMARRRLNQLDLDDVEENYRPLVEALKEVLAASEPLRRKGYGEDAEEEIKAFIEDELTALVERIDELDNG